MSPSLPRASPGLGGAIDCGTVMSAEGTLQFCVFSADKHRIGGQKAPVHNPIQGCGEPLSTKTVQNPSSAPPPAAGRVCWGAHLCASVLLRIKMAADEALAQSLAEHKLSQ